MLAFHPIPAPLVAEEVFEIGGAPKGRKEKTKAISLKPIAPYNRDIGEAAKQCFDREKGAPIDPSLLKTYRMALAQYHLSPESKFLNGQPFDRGLTRRRHVEAIAIITSAKRRIDGSSSSTLALTKKNR